MWCARCQADVAAEASPESMRLYCATCGTDLTQSLASSGHSDQAPSKPLSKDPHELLARWAGSQLPTPPPVRKGRESDRQQVHSAFPERHSAPSARPTARHKPVMHPPHSLAAPHLTPPGPLGVGSGPDIKSTNWIVFAGQMFAYLGVGMLTIGTVMVLVGYFGGSAHYAPTGWLVTTAGQMLLFLGVVTLVSGGMEQTTREVARRIDFLSEKITRIEHGPFAPESLPDEQLPEAQQPRSSRRRGTVEQELREQIALLERQLQQR